MSPKPRKSKTYKLILASQSPRRREILKDAGFEFIVFPSNSSESFNENLTLLENLEHIAEDKIFCILPKLNKRYYKGFLILSADTIVVLGKRVLGKPKNRNDAMRMLRFMSGKVHIVYTAFSLYNPEAAKGTTKVVKTKVGFKSLSNAEIQDYLDSGEPFDKAGAYGIQGAAKAFINLVEGDLLNVIGLPINHVREEFRKQRWKVRRHVIKRKNSRSP